MWGEAPIVPEEIFETFAAYIEGKIPKLVREKERSVGSSSPVGAPAICTCLCQGRPPARTRLARVAP